MWVRAFICSVLLACLLQCIVCMRPPRLIGQDICYHVRVQCNNREFRFKTTDDFFLYESILHHYLKKYGSQLYNYVLMHNHVHLILNITNEFTVDRFMRSVSQVFSRRYNIRKERKGHLWMAPYKSSVIDGDGYAFCCMRYLDRNPVRAKIVVDPKDWRWGGYNFYAYGKTNPVITPIPSFLELGNGKAERHKKYRKFIEQVLPMDEVKDKEWMESKWPKATKR